MNLDVSRQLEPHDWCWWCTKKLAVDPNNPEGWPHWTYWATYTRRKRTLMFFKPVCAVCFEMDKAIEIAKAEAARFTEIALHERHHCGRTLHAGTGCCMTCSRDLRVVERRWAEAQIARRMANQLLREARQKAAS